MEAARRIASAWRVLRVPAAKRIAQDKRRLERLLRSLGMSRAVATRAANAYFDPRHGESNDGQ